MAESNIESGKISKNEGSRAAEKGQNMKKDGKAVKISPESVQRDIQQEILDEVLSISALSKNNKKDREKVIAENQKAIMKTFNDIRKI